MRRAVVALVALAACEQRFIAGPPTCTQSMDECARANRIPAPDGPAIDAPAGGGPDGPPADAPVALPGPGAWQPLAAAGAPMQRFYGVLACAGRSALVIGESNPGVVPPDRKTYVYDAASDRWRAGADLPAGMVPNGLRAVDTGSGLVVYAQMGGGARYDVGGDSWTALPVEGAPTGSLRALLWHPGQLVVLTESGGATLAPAAATWTALPAQSLTAGVAATVAGDLVVTYDAQGARGLDLVARQWAELGTGGNRPELLDGAHAVWSGSEVFIVGGTSVGGVLGRYDPATRTWGRLPMVDFRAIYGALGVWLGDMLFVGGGTSGVTRQPFPGHLYRPGTASWVPMAGTGILAGESVSACWTGQELVVWDARASMGQRWRP